MKKQLFQYNYSFDCYGKTETSYVCAYCEESARDAIETELSEEFDEDETPDFEIIDHHPTE